MGKFNFLRRSELQDGSIPTKYQLGLREMAPETIPASNGHFVVLFGLAAHILTVVKNNTR